MSRRLFLRWRAPAIAFACVGVACAAGPRPPADPVAPWAWEYAEAPVRVRLKVPTPQTVPEAGVLAIVPDGGRLPGPYAWPRVVDGAGRPLVCGVVWHNPAEGLGVVFAPPADGVARLYLTASPTPPPPVPATLRPGLLLYTKTVANPSLAEAAALARETPPGRSAVLTHAGRIGHVENPAGPDTRYVSWYRGYFTVKSPTVARYATVSDDGSELKIDDGTVVKWDGTHPRGGPGEPPHTGERRLDAGVHRIDYLHFQGEGAAEAHALRANAAGEFTTITAAMTDPSVPAIAVRTERRDGAPVATILGRTAPVGYLWFGEDPVLLYELSADPEATPPGATVSWEFDDGRRVSGPKAFRLCAGERRESVRLTVRAGGGAGVCAMPLSSWSPPPAADANRPETARHWLDAFVATAGAAPAGTEPAKGWGESLWLTLLALEGGGEVAAEIAAQSPTAVAALATPVRLAVEDARVGAARRSGDPAATCALLTALASVAPDAARRRELAELRAEVLALAGDPAAPAEARRLLADARDDRERRAAGILLGDIARLAGRVAEARAAYEAVPATPPPGVSRRVRRGSGRAEPSPAETGWRVGVIRSAAYPEELRTLLDAGATREAAAVLRRWAHEAPLDKLGGDLPLAEARLLAALGDPAAAERLLAVVTRRDPPLRNTPEMLALRIRLLHTLNRPEAARDVAAELVARFPGHRAAFDALPRAPRP